MLHFLGYKLSYKPIFCEETATKAFQPESGNFSSATTSSRRVTKPVKPLKWKTKLQDQPQFVVQFIPSDVVLSIGQDHAPARGNAISAIDLRICFCGLWFHRLSNLFHWEGIGKRFLEVFSWLTWRRRGQKRRCSLPQRSAGRPEGPWVSCYFTVSFLHVFATFFGMLFCSRNLKLQSIPGWNRQHSTPSHALLQGAAAACWTQNQSCVDSLMMYDTV